MTNETSSSGGVGFLGLLAVLFIGLKLAGLIHWNWLWVLTPIWFPLAVLLLVLWLTGILSMFWAYMRRT